MEKDIKRRREGEKAKERDGKEGRRDSEREIKGEGRVESQGREGGGRDRARERGQ